MSIVAAQTTHPRVIANLCDHPGVLFFEGFALRLYALRLYALRLPAMSTCCAVLSRRRFQKCEALRCRQGPYGIHVVCSAGP